MYGIKVITMSSINWLTVVIVISVVIILLILAVIAAIIVVLIIGNKEKKKKDAWKYLPPSEEIPSPASTVRTERVENNPDAKKTVPLWGTPGEMPVQHYYVVFEELGTGARYSTKIEKSILVGRADPADILIVSDSAVSRRHCQITRKGNRFILSDLGSGNGTEYNGTKISEDVMISNGDTIGIGRSKYKVLIELR